MGNSTLDSAAMSSSARRLSERWLALALLYFVLAVALGVAMGTTHDFRLRGVHVHLNLLGWVSMSLMGLVLRVVPAAAEGRLAAVQFWLYQLALPAAMTGLAGLLLGHSAFVPLSAAGSVAVALAVLLFAVAVWRALARAWFRAETPATGGGSLVSPALAPAAAARTPAA